MVSNGIPVSGGRRGKSIEMRSNEGVSTGEV